jgi:hypothetical protein
MQTGLVACRNGHTNGLIAVTLATGVTARITAADRQTAPWRVQSTLCFNYFLITQDSTGGLPPQLLANLVRVLLSVVVMFTLARMFPGMVAGPLVPLIRKGRSNKTILQVGDTFSTNNLVWGGSGHVCVGGFLRFSGVRLYGLDGLVWCHSSISNRAIATLSGAADTISRLHEHVLSTHPSLLSTNHPRQ